MKILHIVPPSRRMMKTFMQELRKRYDKDEHSFYFINHCLESEKELFTFGNVYEMTGANRWEKMMHLKRHMDDADFIVWHGMIYRPRHLLFASQKKYLKKSVWLMWGIDLYNYEEKGNGIKAKINNAIHNYWRKNVAYIIALLSIDYDYYRKKFPKSKSKCFVAPYPISYDSFRIMNQKRHSIDRLNGKICIEVAHNNHPFNNHVEILNKLANFGDEDIRLYLPLSYGEEKDVNAPYIARVVKETERLFPQKAYCLWRLMPQNEYTEFLWNMDIAVFDADRQNALGNIIKLLYMGNKVYLSPNSPLYNFFLKKGIEVFNTKEIDKMEFSEFIRKPNNENVVKWVNDYYYPDNAMKLWANIFDTLTGGKMVPKQVKADYSILTADYQPQTKPNSVFVKRYLKWKKDTNGAKNLIIIGVDLGSAQLLESVERSNKNKINYFVKGILSSSGESITKNVRRDDVIGCYDSYSRSEGDVWVCGIYNNGKREVAASVLEERGIVPDNWIENETLVSPYIKMGCGNTLIGSRTVNFGCSFGDYNYMLDGHMGHDCEIGSLSFVGRGTNLAQNVKIGNKVYLGDSTEIGAGTVVGDNSIVDMNVKICINAKIGENVKIGKESKLGNIGSCMWKEYLEMDEGIVIGNNTRIERNTELLDNVKIGANGCIERNSFVGQDCVIGEGIGLSAESHIGNDNHVGDNVKIGARFSSDVSCVIGDNVVIGTNCVLGKCCKIGNGSILEDGVRLKDYTEVAANTRIFAKDYSVDKDKEGEKSE